MSTTQYTIRAVPAKLDSKLRAQARKSGKSLNETILESLAKGAGINLATQEFHDLDWFVGSMSPDEDLEFDEAIKWLDSMPSDIQKDID